MKPIDKRETCIRQSRYTAICIVYVCLCVCVHTHIYMLINTYTDKSVMPNVNGVHLGLVRFQEICVLLLTYWYFQLFFLK